MNVGFSNTHFAAYTIKRLFMNHLEEIRGLIRCMKREEIKLARTYLRGIDKRGEKSPDVAVKVFEALVDEVKTGKILSADVLKSQVYGKGRSTDLYMLLSRMRDKLYETLTLDVNIDRRDVYSDRTKTMLQARKIISCAQIIVARGRTDIAHDLLKKLLPEILKFELYEECLMTLNSLISIYSTSNQRSELLETQDKHQIILLALQASTKAQNIYRDLGQQIDHSAAEVTASELTKHISDLQNKLQITSSATLAFFLNYIEAEFYERQQDFETAAEILQRQCEITEVHPALFTRSRYGGALLNAGRNEIFLHRFVKSIDYCKRALDVLPTEEHFNATQCMDIMIYAHIYSGHYIQAITKIEEQQKREPETTFRNGRRAYWKACVHFLNHEFDKAHRILIVLNPIEKDSVGWNLWLKVLLVLNDIERKSYDNAYNKINNLQRLVLKIEKEHSVSPRLNLIYDILRILSNHQFDFQATVGKVVRQIGELKLNAGPFSWKILSPEIVIFHEWFESKVSKKIYDQKIPPYHKAISKAKI